MPLSLDDLKPWRGTPWGHSRTRVRPAVGRNLHYGSTPDFNTTFTDTNGPRQIKSKYGVIGSGRPKASPKIFEDFTNTDTTSIKLANAQLTTPKVSKFGKWFQSSEQHRETATTSLADKSVRQIWPKRDFGSRRPGIEAQGNMSNLRPDDSLDPAMFAKLYRMCKGSEAHIQLLSTDSDITDGTISKKVTFDLGAQHATRSTAEQKDECRARARSMNAKEAAATKRALWSTEDLEEQLATIKLEEERAAVVVEAKANAEEAELAATPRTREDILDLNGMLICTIHNYGAGTSIPQSINGKDDETVEEEQRGRVIYKRV